MPKLPRAKKVSIDEIKGKAMEDLNFFKGLVDNTATAADLGQFLRSKGLKVSLQDLPGLQCALKYGTITLTAREYLDIVGGPRKIKAMLAPAPGPGIATSVVWRT